MLQLIIKAQTLSVCIEFLKIHRFEECRFCFLVSHHCFPSSETAERRFSVFSTANSSNCLLFFRCNIKLSANGDNDKNNENTSTAMKDQFRSTEFPKLNTPYQLNKRKAEEGKQGISMEERGGRLLDWQQMVQCGQPIYSQKTLTICLGTHRAGRH